MQFVALLLPTLARAAFVRKQVEVDTRGTASADVEAFPQVTAVVDQLGWRDLSAIGGKGYEDEEYLVRAMVPPPGAVYTFKSREKVGMGDMFWQDQNKYTIELDEIQRPGQPLRGLSADLFTTQTHSSWTGGHDTVHIHDPSGQDVFNIRRTRHSWNLLEWKLNPLHYFSRHSYRIVCPGCKDNDKALFTINRDLLTFAGETWRVYRGRERDGDLLYTCQGRWWHGLGAKMTVYKGDADSGRVVGLIEQNKDAGFWLQHENVEDSFTIEVHEGEDSALLLMLSIVIDNADDRDTGDARDARNTRNNGRNGRRHGRRHGH